MHFKINLTLISLLAIFLFFNIPFYRHWLDTNILGEPYLLSNNLQQMDLEQRKVNRFGYSYMIYKELDSAFPRAGITNPLVLLPPDKFMKENGVTNVSIVEPMIFYYLTQRKAVWYDSPDVMKANCVLMPDSGGRVVLRKINNQQELNEYLTVFRKYKLDL